MTMVIADSVFVVVSFEALLLVIRHGILVAPRLVHAIINALDASVLAFACLAQFGRKICVVLQKERKKKLIS